MPSNNSLKSDTFKADYDSAIKVPNSSLRNIPKEVIRSALKLNCEEFSFEQIRLNFRFSEISNEDIETALFELCTVKRGEILVHDENSNLYRFNNFFLKNYALLQFRNESDSQIGYSSRKDTKVIERLLEIIEKDIFDEYDIFIEEI